MHVEECKSHLGDPDRHLAPQGATQDRMVLTASLGHVTAGAVYVRRSAHKAQGALRDMTHSNCDCLRMWSWRCSACARWMASLTRRCKWVLKAKICPKPM